MSSTAVTTLRSPRTIVGNELVVRMLTYAKEFEALKEEMGNTFDYNMRSNMDTLAHICRNTAGLAMDLPKMEANEIEIVEADRSE